MVELNHNLIYGFANKRNLDLDEWYGLLALELCRTIPKYNPERGALSTYYYLRCDSLIRIERDKANTQMRSHNGMLELDESLVADESDDLEEKALLDELLKYGNNEVVMMRYKGFTQSEIADKLGVSQPHISTILEGIYDRYKEGRSDDNLYG